MPSGQFLSQCLTDSIEIKHFSFFGKLAMKDNLKQQVTQFFLHFMIISSFNGIDKLVNFFHRMKFKRLMILLLIPRASVRCP